MPIGLMIANRDSADRAGVVAELDIMGATLIERTARELLAAGAERLIVLSDRGAPWLRGVIARLAEEGHVAEIVSTIDMVAADVAGDQALLLVGDGHFVDAATLALLASQEGATALTIADTPGNAAWERIDATRRWGGAMRCDGTMLCALADLPADWDAGSTLLRLLLQGSGRLLPAGDGALMAMVDGRAEADALARALIERAADVPRGMADRLLLVPLARLAAPSALRLKLDPLAMAWTGAGATLAAAVAAGFGHAAGGLALVLLGGALAAVARRIALVSRRDGRTDRPECFRGPAAALALSAAALGAGEGAAIAVASLFAFLFTDARQRRLFTVEDDRAGWTDLDSLAWLLMPAAVAGAWLAGSVTIAAVTFVSFLDVQSRSRRRN